MLKEEKDTQGIHNIVSDFSTPQSHAIYDGSSVISKGWCVRGA